MRTGKSGATLSLTIERNVPDTFSVKSDSNIRTGLKVNKILTHDSAQVYDSDSEEEMIGPSRSASTPAPTSLPVASNFRQESGSSSEEEIIFSSVGHQHREDGRSYKDKPITKMSDTDDDEEMVGLSSKNASTSGCNNLDNSPSLRFPRPGFFSSSVDEGKFEHLVLDDTKGIKVPSSQNKFLRDYQREGVRFLWEIYKQGRGGILADDMGLGKTVQVICFLSAIMGKDGDERDDNRRINAFRAGRLTVDAEGRSSWPTAMIIVPQSVAGNWQSELDTWGYFEHMTYGSDSRCPLRDFKLGKVDIILSTHEYVALHIEELKDLPFACIFVDEAHKLKNPATKLTKSMHLFKCKARFAMTGTVIQNRNEEMWTLLDWTNPGAFGSRDAWRYVITLPLKVGQRKGASDVEVETRRIIAACLTQELLPRFMLRRTKALIADQMPKKIDKVVFCPLADMQLAAYRRVCDSDDVRAIRESQGPCHCGSRDEAGLPYRASNCCLRNEWSRLRRLCFTYLYLLTCLANHCALFFPGEQPNAGERDDVHERWEKQRQYTREIWPDQSSDLRSNATTGLDPNLCGKWLVLRDLLQQWSDNGDKVLIFSRNLRLLDWLEKWLQQSRWRHLRLDGNTHQSLRQKMVVEFNRHKEIFCFLISTNAGGTGLNLTGANKVVVFDPNWSPAADAQAVDRAYRLGQTRDVSVYRLIGAGTIEEGIYGRQIVKATTAEVSYTAAEGRRFFAGVEGRSDLQGELFGWANLLTFRPESLIKEAMIRDFKLESAVGDGAIGEDGHSNVDDNDDNDDDEADDEGQASDEFDNDLRRKVSSRGPVHHKRTAKSAPLMEDHVIRRRGIKLTHDHHKTFGHDQDDGASKRAKVCHERGTSASSWPPPRARSQVKSHGDT